MNSHTYPPDFKSGSPRPRTHQQIADEQAQAADYNDVRAWEMICEIRSNPALHDAFFRLLMEEHQ